MRLPHMATLVSHRDLCKACLWLGLTAYGGPAMVGHVRDVIDGEAVVGFDWGKLERLLGLV